MEANNEAFCRPALGNGFYFEQEEKLLEGLEQKVELDSGRTSEYSEENRLVGGDSGRRKLGLKRLCKGGDKGSDSRSISNVQPTEKSFIERFLSPGFQFEIHRLKELRKQI